MAFVTRVFSVLTLLVLASGAQAAPTPCPPVIAINFGTFAEKSIIQTKPAQYEDMLSLVQTTLSQGTFVFRLERSTAKTCWFKNKALNLEALVASRGQTVNVTLSRNFSTESADKDTTIFINRLLMVLKFKIKPELATTGALTSATKSNVAVSNRFSFYYSCGFTDCTEEEDVLNTLGTFSSVTILAK